MITDFRKRRVGLQIKLASLILMLLMISSCGWLHPSSQRKVEKKQAEADRQADKEYAKVKKQHLKNQSKQTVRMMKKSQKHASELNTYKKRGTFRKRKCN